MIKGKQSQAVFFAVVEVAKAVALQLVRERAARGQDSMFCTGCSGVHVEHSVKAELERQFDEAVTQSDVRTRMVAAACAAVGITQPSDEDAAAIERALNKQTFTRGRRVGFDEGFAEVRRDYMAGHLYI